MANAIDDIHDDDDENDVWPFIDGGGGGVGDGWHLQKLK